MQTLADSQFEAALQAAQDPSASADERGEMLMEIAMGLQQRPLRPRQLHDAVALYRRALEQAERPVLRARIQARLGTALQGLPDGDAQALLQARDCYEAALPVLRGEGTPPELAELQMNLGLALQALANAGLAAMREAIGCYQDALRTFTLARHPREFAILHNNLAIAYLAVPADDRRLALREALAVQSFEQVLKVVTLRDQPVEYAMIQNNLGNALQYAASGHPLDNNLRALAAYDEALKVRNARDTPVEYANTIANMANVLGRLPAGAQPDLPPPRERALALYREARELFERNGLVERAALMTDALTELGA